MKINETEKPTYIYIFIYYFIFVNASKQDKIMNLKIYQKHHTKTTMLQKTLS